MEGDERRQVPMRLMREKKVVDSRLAIIESFTSTTAVSFSLAVNEEPLAACSHVTQSCLPLGYTSICSALSFRVLRQ
jgi:hypothetical protein